MKFKCCDCGKTVSGYSAVEYNDDIVCNPCADTRDAADESTHNDNELGMMLSEEEGEELGARDSYAESDLWD